MVRDWPDGAPRWEPYLCWQVGAQPPDEVERLRALAAEEFEDRHGERPGWVFYRLRAIYAGPVTTARGPCEDEA